MSKHIALSRCIHHHEKWMKHFNETHACDFSQTKTLNDDDHLLEVILSDKGFVGRLERNEQLAVHELFVKNIRQVTNRTESQKNFVKNCKFNVKSQLVHIEHTMMQSQMNKQLPWWVAGQSTTRKEVDVEMVRKPTQMHQRRKRQ